MVPHLKIRAINRSAWMLDLADWRFLTVIGPEAKATYRALIQQEGEKANGFGS